jgi:hypothetical protein
MDESKWGMVSGRPFELPRYKCMIKNAFYQAESLLSRELLFRRVDTIEDINLYGIYYDKDMIYLYI